MKLNKIFFFGALAALSLTSCNDFLDKNRNPLDKQIDEPGYWNSAPNVEAQINDLYANFLGYGNGTSWVNNFYYRSISDDQCQKMQSGSGIIFANWEYQYAPESNSIWDDSYEVIRRCNFIINNVGSETCTLGKTAKENYVGQARLNRAYQYWDLVRNFGDVPLIKEVLTNISEQLYGPRVDRNKVMDFVLEDLDYACTNIGAQNGKVIFSKDMAQAMKAEICLFEASYAKYHQNDNERAKKYFGEVVKACEAVMGQKYSICNDYQSLYNSTWDTDLARGFASLRENPEVIFMKGYSSGVFGHSMIKYLSSNTAIAGMTKDAFDAYLFLDGKPVRLQADRKDAGKLVDVPTVDKDGNVTYSKAISIEECLTVRDKRLAATIDPFLAFSGVSYQRSYTNAAGKVIRTSDPLGSGTGYLIKKFINPNTTYNENTNDGSNFVCAPLYWLAEIYLNYAEAKAELGSLSEADVKLALAPLYKRAGLPEPTKASLEAINDPANDTGISSLLWEIRRCRRCELMFDNYIRYWDLIRWHQLERLDTQKYPNIAMGANISMATQYFEELKEAAKKADKAIPTFPEMTDGYIDAAKNANGTSSRIFEERQYLQPIGTTQIRLQREHDPATKFANNPGWE